MITPQRLMFIGVVINAAYHILLPRQDGAYLICGSILFTGYAIVCEMKNNRK
jgi:hypothetical protein